RETHKDRDCLCRSLETHPRAASNRQFSCAPPPGFFFAPTVRLLSLRPASPKPTVCPKIRVRTSCPALAQSPHGLGWPVPRPIPTSVPARYSYPRIGRIGPKPCLHCRCPSPAPAPASMLSSLFC